MNWTEDDIQELERRRLQKRLSGIVAESDTKKERQRTKRNALRVSEHDEQKTFLAICKAHEKKYPALARIYAVPNGGFRHPATAAKMKAEGQKAGKLDIALDDARGGYHGFKLEMKAEGGSVSKEQFREYQVSVNAGYYCNVAWGADEAWQITEQYMKMEPTQ